MKHERFFNIALLIVACILVFSCGTHNNNAFGRSFEPYEDSVLNVTATYGKQWKGNVFIKTSAIIQTKKLIFELNLSDVKTGFYGFDTEKYSNTDLHYTITFNDKDILSEIVLFKKKKKAGSMYNNMNDSTGIFFEPISLERSDVKILIPVYFAKKIKAGSDVKVKVRLWQDYFISNKIYDERSAYTRDTLKNKLIDNVYSFSFKMPAIFKTEIICDSFALQNNEKWSPGGSDNTIFKSSYPDLFYSVDDYGYFTQSTSHIEKSTGKFELADTLVLYRYKQHEPFKLSVYDYDLLSKNDLLGDTLLDPELLPENKTSVLNFWHVQRFYLRKKNYGKIN